MRRGTLLLNDATAEALPTFNLNGTPELLAIPLLLPAIARIHSAFRPRAQVRVAHWLGDLGAGGKGDVHRAAMKLPSWICATSAPLHD